MLLATIAQPIASSSRLSILHPVRRKIIAIMPMAQITKIVIPTSSLLSMTKLHLIETQASVFPSRASSIASAMR